MMRPWALIIFGAGIVALGIVYAVSGSSPPQTNALMQERAEMEERIKNDGGANVAAWLRSTYATVDVQSAHAAAHVFGEALYAEEGVAAFSTCDASFGFGCFHSFIASAISEQGDDIVKELDDACVRTYGVVGLGCPHGIGHGLISYEGYTVSALVHALSICDGLSWKGIFGGCRDGVFMEYNFRTMEEAPQDRVRAYSFEDRHEPCESLAQASKHACYFNLASWWISSLSQNATDEFVTFCEEIADTALIETCFRGLGSGSITNLMHDAGGGIAFCDSLPVSRERRRSCREGVAWALYADPATRETALLACTSGLSESEREQCSAEHLFYIQ